MKDLLIFSILGGILGALSRFYAFEISTFCLWQNILIFNLLGCLIAGFSFIAIHNKKVKYFIINGFCGAFTSMSALIFLLSENLKNYEANMIAINLLANCILGTLLSLLGLLLGSCFRHKEKESL